MKPWCETLRLKAPLRDVRWGTPVSEETLAQQRHERERGIFEQGRLEGEKALGAQLVRQRAELQEVQNGVLESLRQVVPKVAAGCERALVELALETARKLVAGLPVSAEMVEAAVREAVDQVEEATEFYVHLQADDLELLRRVNSPMLLPGGGDRLHFRPSPEVTRGGCVVHTRFGVVDARRETKFELLRESLSG
jgi:flagellar assembly protein FliH